MKTILGIAAFLTLLIVVVFASDIRDAANTFLAEHGHPRRVDVQVHGCAVVKGVQYCIDTVEVKP